MSNTQVGQLYKRIIDAVIETSRADFEESGVDYSTIEQLQETWQAHLSQSHRAHFPWDPAPPEPTENSSSAPTKTPSAQNAPSQSPAQGPSGQQSSSAGSAQVKQEPGLDTPNNFMNYPQASAHISDQRFAQQRAAQLVQQQFGSQGMNSIGAFQQAGETHPSGTQKPMSGGTANPSPQSPPTQQPKQEPKPEAQIKQEPSQANGLGSAQTDGADEGDPAREQWNAIIERKNARGEFEPLGRVNADRIVRRHAQALQSRLEAGGLLVPLDERYPRNKKRSRKPKPTNSGPLAASPAPDPFTLLNPPTTPKDPTSIPNLDGNNDTPTPSPSESDEDTKANLPGALAGPEDDDAINSDLDDSEDELNEGIEGNEFDGDTILCLYDKVQRVKNKWKCGLKDGVATVGGKDYVFNRANGEFEW